MNENNSNNKDKKSVNKEDEKASKANSRSWQEPGNRYKSKYSDTDLGKQKSYHRRI